MSAWAKVRTWWSRWGKAAAACWHVLVLVCLISFVRHDAAAWEFALLIFQAMLVGATYQELFFSSPRQKFATSAGDRFLRFELDPAYADLIAGLRALSQLHLRIERPDPSSLVRIRLHYRTLQQGIQQAPIPPELRVWIGAVLSAIVMADVKPVGASSWSVGRMRGGGEESFLAPKPDKKQGDEETKDRLPVGDGEGDQ